MISFFTEGLNRLVGRGDAAITVPPMDGPFRANNIIEDAEVVTELSDGVDIAFDGSKLWLAQGNELSFLLPDGKRQICAMFDGPLTAIAAVPNVGIAVAVNARDISIYNGKVESLGHRTPAGKPFYSITSISPASDGSLYVADASRKNRPDAWTRDLLEHGKTGRVCQVFTDSTLDKQLISGLRYVAGVMVADNGLWISESWAHQIVSVDLAAFKTQPAQITARLPAYAGRMTATSDGGAWVCMFSARRRLVELVLRERRFRRLMMQEVDPRYWIAPMLSSGNSFQEPLQGGNVKSMGISKPWVPPRSYGLVLRLDPHGQPLYSLHSRTDGRHHGIVSAVEAYGALYMLSKGANLLLKVRLSEIEEHFL